MALSELRLLASARYSERNVARSGRLLHELSA
jgi:hypothetical protein